MITDTEPGLLSAEKPPYKFVRGLLYALMQQGCPAGQYIVADLADTGLAGIIPAGRYFAVDFVALDFAALVVGPVDFAV